MQYTNIEPFPLANNLQSTELRALSSVWTEKRAELEGSGVYADFLKKLQREWAIETGIIERLYSWDRGVTEVLIEQGIEASIIAHRGAIPREKAEQIRHVIDDHMQIVDGLFAYVKGDEPLTEHFVRGLQAQFTAHQDFTEAVTPDGQLINVELKKGKYKTLPNNPRRDDNTIHIYCPPEFVEEEMARLVKLYREAEATEQPEVRAAWLHHRFTQIHPFQDGNGRVARALASLVFLRAGLFPVVIREADRTEYIQSLEKADRGDLKPLVDLFSRRQREAILKAIGLEQQVQQNKYANEIIASTLKLLASRFSREKKKIEKVYEYAENLLSVAAAHIEQLYKSLDGPLHQLTPPNQDKYYARTSFANNKSAQRYYFQKQIVAIANKFDYFANFEHYRAWIRLSIHTSESFEYLISIHGYGPGDSGILSISAFSFQKAPTEDGGMESINIQPAATDLFQFNWIEPYESIKSRFDDWLQSSSAIALAEWKRSIN